MINLKFEECLVKIKTPKKLKKRDYISHGNFPVVAQEESLINGYTNDESLLFYVKEGIIIFGDHTRCVKFIDFNFVLGADGAKILKTTEEIDTKFFYYYLVAVMPKSIGYARHYRLLKKLYFDIPPLPIQKQIVEKLDTAFSNIDKAIRATQKNVKNSEALFQRHLEDVFTKTNDWNSSKLGDICEMYQPKTISKKEMVEDGVYPVFGANGIIGNYNKYNHEEEQLLITCRGATCGTVNVSKPFSWINGNAMVVKPKIKNIDFTYLKYFFEGGVDLKQSITGAAQPQITRQTLTPVKFFYPPLLIQKQIVDKLDNLFNHSDNLKEINTKKMNELKNLKSAILNQTFSDKPTKTTS